MAKLWCFDDAHNWGKMLFDVAAKRGHEAHLFEDPRSPDQGYVFMHMHHHPQVRILHKRMMAIMSMNPDLRLIPDYRSSVLYDDKTEQARQLSRWMPRTHIFYTPGGARRFLEANHKFPFLSKTAEGASSHNVRLISTIDQAKLEIRQAFSDLGIKCHYGQQQRGYLLWQDFIPGNEGDIRIVAVGTKRLILRRGNRPDRPMASGSGRLTPIVDLTDLQARLALEVANEFFAAEQFKWAGIDMVRDAEGKWYILETTVGWTLNGYYECSFIDCYDNSYANAISKGPRVLMNGEGPVRGDAIWQVLVDEIEAGAFQ